MRKLLFLLFVAAPTLPTSFSFENETSASPLSKPTPEANPDNCRLIGIMGDVDGEGLEGNITWGCEVEENGFIYMADRDAKIPEWMEQSLQNGDLMEENMIISRKELQFNKQEQFSISSSNKPLPHRHHHRRQLQRAKDVVAGVRKVLIVGVVAENDDVASTANNTRMSDSVFGIHGDSVNLASQYSACSERKLTFRPAQNRTGINGVKIHNGAVTISIATKLSEGHLSVMNAVTKALEAEFRVQTVRDLADHAIYCLPPGIPGFHHAYAYVNGWVSWYNDVMCTYATYQIHEVGHNLGLGHAGHDVHHPTYGDETGYMGFSWTEDDGPRACFNAANFYQLGWFRGKCQADLRRITRTVRVALVGFSRGKFACRRRAKKVVRIVHPRHRDHDLYVLFNLQTRHNRGTFEYGNNVTVVTKRNNNGGPYSYGPTMLEAHLSQGRAFTFRQQALAPDCFITIVCRRLDVHRGIALIDIGRTGRGCSA